MERSGSYYKVKMNMPYWMWTSAVHDDEWEGNSGNDPVQKLRVWGSKGKQWFDPPWFWVYTHGCVKYWLVMDYRGLHCSMWSASDLALSFATCILLLCTGVGVCPAHVNWVLDITIAYPEGKPLDLGAIVTGYREPCKTFLFYRLFPCKEVIIHFCVTLVNKIKAVIL